MSLQKHFKSSEFFYLGAHENHFQGKLKEFNINIKTLDLGLKYFGFRWWHFLVAKKRFIDLSAKERERKFVTKKKRSPSVPSRALASSLRSPFGRTDGWTDGSGQAKSGLGHMLIQIKTFRHALFIHYT